MTDRQTALRPTQISIIGASSFIARSISNRLHSLHPDIKLIEYGRAGFDHQFSLPGHGVENLDIEALLRSQAVIYCAGAGVQPGPAPGDDILEQVNATQPIALIESLIEGGYEGQVITFGSYFELGEIRVEETDACGPRDENYLVGHNNKLPNAYVHSKRRLTQYIAKKLPGLKKTGLLHLVLSNVYGVGENEHRLLPYMARQMAAGETIELTAGLQERQYTHVADIARFVVNRALDSKCPGIYNFTDPDVIQVAALAERFCALAGFDTGGLAFSRVEKRDTSMNYLALSMDKTAARFGRMCFSGLDENLNEYLE